eukprot:16605-Pleurochrysis_carterae.AAC.2
MTASAVQLTWMFSRKTPWKGSHTTAITLPLTASERALLMDLEPSDGNCAECESSNASATAAVHQFAAPSSRSSKKDKRGGYSREPDENGVRKGI